MTLREIRHAVWRRSDRVGTLVQRGDHTRFVFSQKYLNNPDRPVLGLIFEQNLSARHAAALRLPCWFSNLLPPVRLVHRDELDGLPSDVWPSREEWAYAIRRFDRDEHRDSVHIEDLAQVRNVYPEDKYLGNYETVAALAHRGHDLDSLREFARRLAFTILIANGDAHLKNWSLIYSDPRVPSLRPPEVAS